MEDNWLYDTFLPIAFYRLAKFYSGMIEFSSMLINRSTKAACETENKKYLQNLQSLDSEAYDDFKRRLLLRKLDFSWENHSTNTSMNVTNYVLCFGIGNHGNEVDAWSMINISEDGFQVEDISFDLSGDKKISQQFDYDFNKHAIENKEVKLCRVADLDLPVSAIEQLRARIEQRDPREYVYLLNEIILEPGESCDEVLIKRDLDGYNS